MRTAIRRKQLSLLAAEDLAQLERDGHRPGLGQRSWATWAADVGFWLVYGAGVLLVVSIAIWGGR